MRPPSRPPKNRCARPAARAVWSKVTHPSPVKAERKRKCSVPLRSPVRLNSREATRWANRAILAASVHSKAMRYVSPNRAAAALRYRLACSPVCIPLRYKGDYFVPQLEKGIVIQAVGELYHPFAHPGEHGLDDMGRGAVGNGDLQVVKQHSIQRVGIRGAEDVFDVFTAVLQEGGGLAHEGGFSQAWGPF